MKKEVIFDKKYKDNKQLLEYYDYSPEEVPSHILDRFNDALKYVTSVEKLMSQKQENKHKN